jgi:hypothetical protein
VESILLPSYSQRREFRVVGEKTTIQGFIDAFGKAKGTKYEVVKMDPNITREKQLEAWAAGDEPSQMLWSALEYLPRGAATVKGDLDNDKFSFKPQTLDEVLKAMTRNYDNCT